MPDKLRSSKESGVLLEEMLNKQQPLKWPNAAPDAQSPGGGLPKVERAPAFRPYPEVVGGKALHEAIRQLLDKYPQLQGKVDKVTVAPTMSVIDQMVESEIDPTEYQDTNLLGNEITFPNKSRATIYINPNLDSPNAPAYINDKLHKTVAHEFSHSVGYGEKSADLAGELMNRIRAGK